MKKSSTVVAIAILAMGLVVAQEPPGWVPLGDISSATRILDMLEIPGTSILLASGQGGSFNWYRYVWRSTDGGATWATVIAPLEYQGPDFVQLDRDSASGRLWALKQTSGANTLYYSTDNGANWTGASGPSASPAVVGNTMQVVDDYVYFGGTIGSPYSISLYRLHQTDLTWEELVVYPECDAITQLKWQDDRLFVFCRDRDEAKVRVFTYTP